MLNTEVRRNSIILNNEDYRKIRKLFLWRSFFTQKFHFYGITGSQNDKRTVYILEKQGRLSLNISKFDENLKVNYLLIKQISSIKERICNEELSEITGEKITESYLYLGSMLTERSVYIYDKNVKVYLDINRYFGFSEFEMIIEYKQELPVELWKMITDESIYLKNFSTDKYSRFISKLITKNDTYVQLPMVLPPYVTYQGMAFMMGIILSHCNIKNYMYNNFTSIRCGNSDEIWDLSLELADILWDSLSGEGILEQDFFEIKYLCKETIISFLKERLEQSSYILLYEVDEYYLSHSIEYQKNHYIHDIYLYGYDKDTFYVMAYKDEKLQLFNISQIEIRDALFACENSSFCTCRPNKEVDVEINYDRMKRNLIDYFNGKEEENYLYGIRIYEPIINSLNKIINKNERAWLDIRVFRMLWEHKSILKMQFNKLQEVQNLGNIMEHVENVELTANKIFKLGIKFRMTQQLSILGKMVELLESMRDEEKVYFKLLDYKGV